MITAIVIGFLAAIGGVPITVYVGYLYNRSGFVWETRTLGLFATIGGIGIVRQGFAHLRSARNAEKQVAEKRVIDPASARVSDNPYEPPRS